MHAIVLLPSMHPLACVCSIYIIGLDLVELKLSLNDKDIKVQSNDQSLTPSLSDALPGLAVPWFDQDGGLYGTSFATDNMALPGAYPEPVLVQQPCSFQSPVPLAHMHVVPCSLHQGEGQVHQGFTSGAWWRALAASAVVLLGHALCLCRVAWQDEGAAPAGLAVDACCQVLQVQACLQRWC